MLLKCDDHKHYSVRQSALHRILHDLFLPPPYPMTQINGHQATPNPEEHDGKSFVFFLIPHCPMIQSSHTFIILPYYLHCPNVSNDSEKRCCSTCGICFASITRAAEDRYAVYNALAAQSPILSDYHRTSE